MDFSGFPSLSIEIFAPSPKVVSTASPDWGKEYGRYCCNLFAKVALATFFNTRERSETDRHNSELNLDYLNLTSREVQLEVLGGSSYIGI